MRKRDALDDLELHIDPTPLTKEEQIGLSEFIRKIKAGQIVKTKIKSKKNLLLHIPQYTSDKHYA